MTTFKTRQEIFNVAFLGMKSQGFKMSVNGNGVCAYRSPNGLKCAVGFLIPDDKYSKSLEGLSASSEVILGITEVSPHDKRFLKDLQEIHDISFSPDNMSYDLKVFAENHRLTIPD
jgi:hypothetical protein